MRRKVIKLPKPKDENEDILIEKVSLEQMNEIWNDKKTIYSEDELIRLRDWLYAMAEIIFKTSKKLEKKTIQLNAQNNESKESNIICESEYRRAS